MTIKEQKLVLHFLKSHVEYLLKTKNQKMSPLFENFFSREELITILEHTFFEQDLEEFHIHTLKDNELLELVSSDYFILNYYIEKFEAKIQAKPKINQKEVYEFFERIGEENHYLYEKLIAVWDEYDVRNYYSKIFKHGKAKEVFAIFTSDVLKRDKYLVTTKPSSMFDTREEAEIELKKLIKERKFKRDELKIMNLWQIIQ